MITLANGQQIINDKLTRREFEIAGLVSLGHTNGEIGQMLCLPRKTILQNMRSIYRKVGLTATVRHVKRVQLMLWWWGKRL